ncbi:MAG: competence/damage-inducible protein A [Proteobacteria bacterium]|nr:MAG: competence/damage-inducible protein A [Pseudomonadota bacterium]
MLFNMEEKLMDESLAAGILTIGTEVVSGQIVNSNAAWIANELTNLRLTAAWHLTVADLKADMIDALTYLQSRVKVLIVTGGLGPTSDDFTRNVVAEWANEPLEFDPSSWDNILERFKTLGVTPPESNRQQCYYPRGATILSNRKGTAHGFRLEAHGVQCFILPGPPEEIKAIWADHIAAFLAQQTTQTDTHVLKRWQCLGISESQIAEQVEDLIKGTSLVAGYRPHLPYIEIKIWCKTSLMAKEQPVLDQLDAMLDRWTVVRDEEDVLTLLLQNLSEFDDIHIEDSSTLGALSQRLGQKWQKDAPVTLSMSEHFSSENNVRDIRGKRKLSLIIGPLAEDGSWDIWYKTDNVQKLKTLKLPYKRHPERTSRERLFVCEQSLAAFARLAEKGNLVL